MPFLRFSRDKRGYENTYVLHGFRRGARSRPKVLYWFRTPPNVKIGRLPLDEEAIRAIEENNPDLSFDWSEMLKVRQKPATATLRERADRPTRKRRAASGRAGGGRAAQVSTADAAAAAAPSAAGAADQDQDQDQTVVGPVGADGPIDAEAFPEGVVPDDDEAEGEVERPWQHPVVALIGDDGLARLRARYAELQARISEKLTEPSAREAMRARVEALNPDSWRTGEQVVHGIERFEAAAEEIKKTLGRRRRRSRRGGARGRRPKSPD